MEAVDIRDIAVQRRLAGAIAVAGVTAHPATPTSITITLSAAAVLAVVTVGVGSARGNGAGQRYRQSEPECAVQQRTEKGVRKRDGHIELLVVSLRHGPHGSSHRSFRELGLARKLR